MFCALSELNLWKNTNNNNNDRQQTNFILDKLIWSIAFNWGKLMSGFLCEKSSQNRTAYRSCEIHWHLTVKWKSKSGKRPEDRVDWLTSHRPSMEKARDCTRPSCPTNILTGTPFYNRKQYKQVKIYASVDGRLSYRSYSWMVSSYRLRGCVAI